jgi:hypothetical protein
VLSRYEFYSSFTLWPKEVRGDLRAGIKAKHQGDLDLSARYLERQVVLGIDYFLFDDL